MCLLNLHIELATFFVLLACSGIDMTELPAQPEHLPEGGKLQGGKEVEFPWTFTLDLPFSNLVFPHPQEK